MVYFSAPGASDAPTPYRFLVELWSLQTDEDGDPIETDLVDVLVVEPTIKAIRKLLQSEGLLELWQIVDHWQPDGDIPF